MIVVKQIKGGGVKMRRLKFQFITDSRFDKDIYNKLLSMDKELKELLKSLPVELDELELERLYWDTEPCYQYRKTYYLKKLNRSITWNDIYGTINKIYAPYYKFIR